MKNFLLILLIVIILLWGWFSYLYFNPQLPLSQKVLSMVGITTSTGEVAQIANPASVFCEQNSGTLEIITDLSGWQSWLCHLADGNTCEEWAYFRGECPIKEITGIVNNVLSKDYGDPMLLLLKGLRSNYCIEKIWDIEKLKKDIALKEWWIIEKLSIQDSCGDTREYSSEFKDYKELYNNQKDKDLLENLIQENDTYIVYSLVDTNRDMPMEYPVIIYNKKDKTNTLFTIRFGIPRFEYLDNEWNVIIRMNKEEWQFRYIFNIPNNSVLWEYHTLWVDCWDQALSRERGGSAIILHRFDIWNCGLDYENRNLKREKEVSGTLTLEKSPDYTYPWITLGTFTKTSELHATNEDIMESVKWNTFIFHIDDTKYELSNNQITKK